MQLLWKLSALLEYTFKFDGTLILLTIVNYYSGTIPKHFNVQQRHFFGNHKTNA